jgi:DNA-binding transcriptional LysR family regulator
VSWRRWAGWEPTKVTTYDYDADGRVDVAVSTLEPEWDDQSRGFALALDEYEAGLCPSCKHPLEETSAAHHEDRYTAEPAVRCHRCTASEQAAKSYQDSPTPGALLVPVRFHPLTPEQMREVRANGHS